MKKIIALLITLSMLLSFTCVASAASAKAVVSLSSSSVAASSTFTMTVSLSGAADAKAFMIEPTYDSKVLELVKSEWLVAPTIKDIKADGSAVGGFDGATNINKGIIKYTFKVKAGISRGTKTTLSAKVTINNPYNAEYTASANFTVACTHSFGSWGKYNETNHVRKCKYCSAPQYQAHTWGEGVIVKVATSTEDGEMEYTCSICGQTKIAPYELGPQMEKRIIESTKASIEGFFYPDTVLEVIDVTDEASLEVAKTEKDLAGTFHIYTDRIVGIYDISLYYKGVQIQPNGEILITLDIPAELIGKEFELYHVHENEDGTVNTQNISYTKAGDNKIAFIVSKLSHFAFVELEEPDVPDTPSYDNRAIYLIIAFVAGFGLCYLVFRKKIKRENY